MKERIEMRSQNRARRKKKSVSSATARSRNSKSLARKLHTELDHSTVATTAAVAMPEYENLNELEGAPEFEFVRADDKPEETEQISEEVVEEEEKIDEPSRQSSPGEDLLRLYFRDIGRIPLLSCEEVVRFCQRMERARKRNDKATLRKVKEKLVSANLRLVVSIAKKFSNCGMPLLDLVQAGNMGLMKAVDGFDYKMGFKFSTYASKWIQASITRTISNQVRTVRIPVNVIPALKKVDRTSRKLSSTLGRRPTVPEIAKGSGVESEKIRFMGKIPQHSISLDFPVDGENGDCTLGEILGDIHTPSTSDTVDKHFFREQLESVMKEALDAREQEVIRLRYGLEDGTEHTQSEIAKYLKLSRQRVSQIENKALLRLRHHGGSLSLRSFVN